MLTLSRGDPNIGTSQCAIRHITSTHTNGKSKNHNDGVGTGIREPNVVFKFVPVGGDIFVEVGTRLGSEGAASGGSGPIQ